MSNLLSSTTTTSSSSTTRLLLVWFSLLSLLSPSRAGFFDDFQEEFGDFFNTPGVLVTPPPSPPPPTSPPITQPPTPAPVQPDFHLERVVPAVQAIEAELRNLIAQNPPMGPKFVRLGFHDCAGGCDGCVDLTFPDNAGLDIPINALAPIVQQHESTELGISRADIWALAAHVAADVAQTRSVSKADFHMKFIGRHNCETGGRRCFDMNGTERECSATLGPHVHLPEADITTEEIFHFFASEFGFDVQETVALMGAHTLGSLNRFHSGYDGPNGWVRDNLLLDNDYYHELVGGTSPGDSLDLLIDNAPPWFRVNMDNSDIPNMRNKPAWRAQPPAPDGNGVMEIVMLNADVALVREIDHSNMDANGFVNCEFVQFFATQQNVPRCPHATRSFQFAVDYKFDNDLWLRDFANVYKKMLNHGYSFEPFRDCAGGICAYEEVSFADMLP